MVEFTDEEMVYVERAEKTKSFREVVELAKEIYEFSQQKQEEKEFNPPNASSNNENQDNTDNEVQVSSGDDEKEWPTESDPEDDHRNDRDFQETDADLETPSYEQGGCGF